MGLLPVSFKPRRCKDALLDRPARNMTTLLTGLLPLWRDGATWHGGVISSSAFERKELLNLGALAKMRRC